MTSTAPTHLRLQGRGEGASIGRENGGRPVSEAAPGPSLRIGFGDFVFDHGTRQLTRRGTVVHLEPMAFELLDLLLSQRPKAIAKTHIHDVLWPGTFVSDSNLKRVASDLRGALGDDARHPRFIRTVHGFGYAFAGMALDIGETAANIGPMDTGLTLVYQGRETILRDGENILGRARDAAACIQSPKVSRHHARILVSNGHATLEDLGSLNGTYLRGERVLSPAPL